MAVLTAAAWLWVFRRFSRRERIALAKRQVRARLYAMRLYGGEPALIVRAQKELLLWNLRYLALMLRPTAAVIIPAVILYAQLDHLYGRRPLAPGESAIVTAGFGADAGLLTVEPTLEGHGIVVETPAVRLPGRRQACWRVRAPGAASGSVTLRLPGVAAVKTVDCGSGLRYLSARRTVSARGKVRWIEVSYPAAKPSLFGYRMEWPVWFVVVGLAAMLVLVRAFPGLGL